MFPFVMGAAAVAIALRGIQSLLEHQQIPAFAIALGAAVVALSLFWSNRGGWYRWTAWVCAAFAISVGFILLGTMPIAAAR